MAEQEPLAILKQHFGYESFRPGQDELVGAILDGRDCLGVMPTGAGKSICYQVPALALADIRVQDGFMVKPASALTLVVSPLVSLMSDQVMALRSAGIPAAYLNSRLTPAQQDEVLGRARNGSYALMYVAPERLFDPRFQDFVQASRNISLLAVDEAHCVSQWGQDFRPSYLGIVDFVRTLPERPIVAAFTATATPRVAADIVRLLELQRPVQVTTGFDRPNLHFAVEQLSDKRKLARIAARALGNPAESGIVYCSTRKDVERVHESLLQAGVRATRYHAGLSHLEREANQRAFVNDDAPVMVATNAFGMGIDKSNVRYVLHYNMPGSLEAYYQEAGRAGRDGEPAECLLLWSDSDIATCRFFIEQETGNEALAPDEQQVVRASQRRRLSAMVNYCMTTDCLRATILHYFGDGGAGEQLLEAGPAAGAGQALPAEPVSPDVPKGAGKPLACGCGNCGNCEGQVDAVDVTKTARSVMRCVHELRGRFGKGIVADVLCGSKAAKLREYGLVGKKTYGIVDDSPATVKEIIELLTAGEYLEISEGRYPLVGLGPRAREAATDEFRLYMKRRRAASPASAGHARGESGGAQGHGLGDGAGDGRRQSAASRQKSGAAPALLETEEQLALFERLRKLRKQLADAEGVPPYIVFSDAALRAMCVALPQTPDDFLAVSGVGPVKLERYGQAFLQEINA